MQVRPVQGVDLTEETVKAEAILKATPGLAGVDGTQRRGSSSAAGAVARQERILEELPIPRLIAAQTEKRSPPDLEAQANEN